MHTPSLPSTSPRPERVPLWHADVVTLFDPAQRTERPLYLLAVVDPETSRIWMRVYTTPSSLSWCDLLRRALTEAPLPRRLVVDRALGFRAPDLLHLLEEHDVVLDWGWSEREVRDAVRVISVERTLRRLVQQLVPTRFGMADLDSLNLALDDRVHAH